MPEPASTSASDQTSPSSPTTPNAGNGRKSPSKLVTIIVFAVLIIWVGYETIRLIGTTLYSQQVTAQTHSVQFVESEMGEVATLATIYNPQALGSYKGFCSDSSTVATLQQAAQAAESNGHYTCNDTTTGFAASVPVTNGYVCVDASHQQAILISSDIGTTDACQTY